MATDAGQKAFGRWGAYFVSHLGGRLWQQLGAKGIWEVGRLLCKPFGGGYGNGWGARGNTEAITHQGRQIPPTHVIPAGFSV